MQHYKMKQTPGILFKGEESPRQMYDAIDQAVVLFYQNKGLTVLPGAMSFSPAQKEYALRVMQVPQMSILRVEGHDHPTGPKFVETSPGSLKRELKLKAGNPEKKILQPFKGRNEDYATTSRGQQVTLNVWSLYFNSAKDPAQRAEAVAERDEFDALLQRLWVQHGR